MNEEEVQKQLNIDYEAFLYSTYSGKISVPDDILDLFRIGIMAMPSFVHKIAFLKIKAIYGKEIYQLNYDDLNNIIKVIANVSVERLYPYLEFEDIVQKGIQMDKFILSFNASIEEFTKKLAQKKKTLTDLTSGLRGNGMRIIPNG